MNVDLQLFVDNVCCWAVAKMLRTAAIRPTRQNITASLAVTSPAMHEGVNIRLES
ncbi:hypothetical protein [Allomesorhizobium alhagi]|uniref:hypothetical protein n=1 Tax=Allomesorhizobium alhagi TaxID=475067 RepID=UPI001300C506|nr:hypothetical protein [Mesorhizobium alhagi]